MAQVTGEQMGWEKPRTPEVTAPPRSRERLKFLVGGVIILGVIAFLIVSGTLSGAQYFMTVDQLLSNPEYVGQTVRISGAVIGDTIDYETQTLTIDFVIANIPDKFDNLAVALHNAVNDPDATQLKVHIENQVKPDLLQHEAQAILTGKLGADGVFYATELLLKCPSRFEEAEPGKAIVEPGV
jgi:cytochrome c-type biogenesis protein CcmE